MKWINVKDRLPTGKWSKSHPRLSEEVIICNSCAVLIGYYNRNVGIWYTDEPAENEKYKYLNWIDKVTHWMPLPKSPHERRTE